MDNNKFTVEVVPYADKEYRLIHGHCTNYKRGTRCTNWATRYLVDENGGRVPGGKRCAVCAGETIREYRTKLQLYWHAAPIVLYRVTGQRAGTPQVIWGIFHDRDHAQAYADELNQETP